MVFYGCKLQGSFLYFHACLCSSAMNATCEQGRGVTRVCLAVAARVRTAAGAHQLRGSKQHRPVAC